MSTPIAPLKYSTSPPYRCCEVLAQDAREVRGEVATLGRHVVTRQAEHRAVGRDRLGRRRLAERDLGMVVPLHRGRDHRPRRSRRLEHLQRRVVDLRIGAVGRAEPVLPGRDRDRRVPAPATASATAAAA